MQNNLSWSFEQVWNNSLLNTKPRAIRPRDHIWASEVGGSYVERYLKMKGTAYSNPPNARSLRKFEAGNIFEWIVEIVLRREGVWQSKQDYIEVKIPGQLKVTGKLDHLAGGSPDWERSKAEIHQSDLPDFIKHSADSVIVDFSQKYPEGLKPLVLEVKSVASTIFHRYETYRQADPKHALQLFHYLTGLNMPEGHIIYISKDDLSLAEIGVMNPSPIENVYRSDIKIMTDYFASPDLPPLEKPVEFNEMIGKFTANWKIAYSGYLTMLYGYKDQAEFDEKYKPMVARWNRVLARVVEGKNLTEDNNIAISEMKEDFLNLDELIEIAKTKKGKEEEDAVSN